MDLLTNVSTEAHLDFVERELRAAEAEEASRNQSVQARLTALLGLSSTLVSLSSGLLGLALTAALAGLTQVQLGAIVVILSYVTLQFVGAVYHTANGLLPRTFHTIQLEALEPRPHEALPTFRRVLLSTHRSNLQKNRWSTNRRMDEMTLSIEALRNAARGAAVLLGVVLLIIANVRFGLCVPAEWLVP